MLPKAVILFSFGFFLNSVYSATFENVTVLLTTQLGKLFIHGRPPIATIFIKSSDSLSDYVNLQPLEIISIRNESIPLLKKNSVSNLPHTEYILITSSGIREIQPGAFVEVPRLEGINLQDNSIEEIRNGVFTGLHIKSLFLDDNKISRIESASFNNMSMTLLSLNNNRISRWDSNWFTGTPLGWIYMNNNLVKELPDEAFNYVLEFKKINEPLTVWYLGLDRNRLRKIHPKAFSHVNAFGDLLLANNDLEELPKDIFRSVKNINTLELTNNRIQNVDGFFDDINVYQLILLNNSLSCFPTSVFDVSRISYIFLDGNQLTCECVDLWKDYQVKNNIWVVHDMRNLYDNCIEQK